MNRLQSRALLPNVNNHAAEHGDTGSRKPDSRREARSGVPIENNEILRRVVLQSLQFAPVIGCLASRSDQSGNVASRKNAIQIVFQPRSKGFLCLQGIHFLQRRAYRSIGSLVEDARFFLGSVWIQYGNIILVPVYILVIGVRQNARVGKIKLAIGQRQPARRWLYPDVFRITHDGGFPVGESRARFLSAGPEQAYHHKEKQDGEACRALPMLIITL